MACDRLTAVPAAPARAPQPRSSSRRAALSLLAAAIAFATTAPLPAHGKTKWNDPNPNPGWDKYYGGKCLELERCVQAGDINCLQTSAIPLCNLEVQETGIARPWQKVLGMAAEHGQLEVVQLFVVQTQAISHCA